MNDKHLMRSPSINEIGKIICPDLHYNKGTIKQIVKRITTDIASVTKYIQVGHILEISVIWESKIEIDSFRKRRKKPHRTCRTDQGGELGQSHEFQKMLANEDFILNMTGADASAQNAHAESPNKYLANMMR